MHGMVKEHKRQCYLFYETLCKTMDIKRTDFVSQYIKYMLITYKLQGHSQTSAKAKSPISQC